MIFQYASRDVRKYVLRNCQIVWKRNSEMSDSTEETPWHDKNKEKNPGCRWLGLSLNKWHQTTTSNIQLTLDPFLRGKKVKEGRENVFFLCFITCRQSLGFLKIRSSILKNPNSSRESWNINKTLHDPTCDHLILIHLHPLLTSWVMQQ